MNQFIQDCESSVKVPFVNFPKQYKKYKDEIDAAILSCLHRGDLILRQDVEKFEEEFAKYVGVKYAVGVNSGTDALYLALWAYGIGQGDDVLVPSHTFVATAQVVHQIGANPILYDKGGYFTVTEKTKAIIPAHIAGDFGANMDIVMELAKNRGLIVIEDACQSLGAIQEGKMAGAWGNVGAFSFYPAKIFSCFGDGGALVTNDEKIYNKVKELRDHSKKNPREWGVNSRLDNVWAAVLRVKLKYLPDMLKRRREIAEIYLRELKGVIGLPKDTEGRVWQDFLIETPRREELFEYLKTQDVETMKNEYPMPIGKLPIAEKYEKETLRVPCNDVLTDEEVLYVCEKIKKFFNK